MQLGTAVVQARFGNQGVVPISNNIDYVIVEASPGADAGITCPLAKPGMLMFVVNNTGNNLNLWPNVGDTMPGQSVNQAITINPVTDRIIMLVATPNKTWALSDVQWG